MTTIVIKKKDDYIMSVECSDHTGFAESGKDIVCAGISCITQTAVLGIQNLSGVKHKLMIDEKKGYLKLELLDIDNQSKFHDAQVILKTMELGLKDLKIQYPRYIRLEDN